LILIRDHQRDKQHGRKLDPRWLGPRLLVEYRSEVTALVRNLYGDGTVKKYHIDDMKVYSPRSAQIDVNKFPLERFEEAEEREGDENSLLGDFVYAGALCTQSFTIEQTAMKYASRPGSRAVDLESVSFQGPGFNY